MAQYNINYTPTKAAQAAGILAQSKRVIAPGWKAALNGSDKAFNLAQVRFITDPRNPGVGVAYDEDGQIIGQVTATRQESR